MANQSKKVSELSVGTTTKTTDRLVVLANTTGSPILVTVTIGNLFTNVAISNSAPANSTANGYTGNLRYDSSYVYICVANNTWKRAALSDY